MISQTTLLKSSSFVTGMKLDQDGCSSVRFHPGPPNSGIVFVRNDLPGTPTVKCCLANLRGEARWTSLSQDGVWVRHTEHILAALVGNGIDNVVVEMDSDRIPVVSSGSCKNFSRALLEVSTRLYNVPRVVLELREPIYYETPQGVVPRRCIIGSPSKEFSVLYVFHVLGMRVGSAEYSFKSHSFSQTVGLACTYFLDSESEIIQKLLNPISRDFIVVTPESPQPVMDEVARHKIVDFMGDLAVLGHPVMGRFVAFRSGHCAHHSFAHMLSKASSEVRKE